MRDFGPEQDLRMARVALIGLRGAGKSTLAAGSPRSATSPSSNSTTKSKKTPACRSVKSFLSTASPAYRAIEKRTLERVLRAAGPAVISVAGGIVSEKETYEYLLGHCYHRLAQSATRRTHVPCSRSRRFPRYGSAAIARWKISRRILESREPLYRKADATVDTSGESTDESFAKLKAALQAASL